MIYRRPCLLEVSTPIHRISHDLRLIPIAAILLTGAAFAQDQTQPAAPPDSGQVQAGNQNSNITIPAGTHLPLVLTQPIQTRYIHRGDDIYAQVTSPVNAGIRW